MSRAGTKRPLEAFQSSSSDLQNGHDSSPGMRDPKVSKTVTACTECQKRKIKCDLGPRGDICTRCAKKGLQCVLNKNLQSLLKDEAQWKRDIENDASTTREAVSEILKVLNLPAMETFNRPSRQSFPASPRDKRPAPPIVRFASEVESASNAMPSRRVPAAMAMTRENSQEPEQDEAHSSTIVTDPMGSLYEVTKLRNLRSRPQSRLRQRYTPGEGDFISSGKVSLEDAEQLFEYFSKYLNAYLWGGIALVHPGLMEVRCSSSLLLAAILTVSALHVPGMEAVFDVCYAEFVGLICDSMLDRYHTMDGIRGLTIGAFWLSDLSWKLSGHAVRIATELNLHQSYSKAMKGSAEHIEGARLWLLLYVCDHHFSIAYGRPPVIHASKIVLNHVRLLQLPQVTQADERLHSQVAIFIILTDIYNTFGPDIEEQLTEEDFTRVKNFNQHLDQYRLDWQQRLAPHRYIGSYPAKGVDLHCHYAKLQLNSLALRGLSPAIMILSPGRCELASIAVSSAVMILRLTLEEPDITNAIVGVPLYVHTMITYATVFMLKVHQKWGAQLGMELVQIQDLMSRVMELLRNAKASKRHLAYHIATGVGKMLHRFTAAQRSGGLEDSRVAQESSLNYEAPSVGINAADFDPVAPYGDMISYDEYFPFGFFDVLSAAIQE
ncbi:C6 transcription factor [Mollisia scopiformis]|uniref:C6 transcription factor n=1 Tax=Mollisia scopiformis TaxID=149040 RepID=A0A194XVF7_MOLSC|nr:C6 transcription factor [Mollisia scopiformis]KUJ23692.1 C6 transcription factor [Mollisia scopiformis]